jgi:signal transduction histidine kinase
MTEWLKPPRSLLLILALLALVSLSALGWFDWRLLDQERLVEAQRARERLEQSADRIAANLRRTLAETGDRLAVPGADPAVTPDAVVLSFTGATLTATPPDRLLYYPDPSPAPDLTPAALAEGEVLEFQRADPAAAALWYAKLPGPAALFRRARALRNHGDIDASRAAYRSLAATTGTTIAGAPADLVARHALYELSRDPADAAALARDLAAGRWRLTRGQFAFYWSAAARAEPPPPQRIDLSEAAGQLWESRARDAAARGERTLWVDGRPVFAIWRGAPDHRAALLLRPAALMDEAVSREPVRFAAFDAEGRLVAGATDAAQRGVVRAASGSALPWTLYVAATPATQAAGMLPSQRFLLLGTGVVALFLIAGSYFIARAIRREMEVARMQSDFVSAVSHEFRSPLTSIRQLSELLALGRVPSEPRRAVYYETLVRETARLQRLVESLLNFGRMEAGARAYRFERVDAALLARSVAAEFETQIVGTGRSIELDGPEASCVMEADPESLTVALRNLVDNALKYSPDEKSVWVEWRPQREFVAISVRDRGIGVAPSERKAIFRKFVRGQAAVVANVKGSGVGLAMVRHIVAAHRGQIHVESEPGRGSTFTMLLPGGSAT